MFTQNVTVTDYYLSLCGVLVVSAFLSSGVDFLVLVFCHGGPPSPWLGLLALWNGLMLFE